MTILWWLLPYNDMNQPWVYMCPPSQTPLPSPSPSHPSELSQGGSALFHASNLDWSSISHMVIYMFSAILSHHPTFAFSHSSKVSSLYLCLFCCLTYRIFITIFLNSIYMCYYTALVFIFLAYFTLYNGLQFHPSH